MSSSNHHIQRRGPSPTPRKRHLDSGRESNPKRRGTDRDINARFDRMIETMSPHMGSSGYSHRNNRKRTGRAYSHIDDAYTLPTPEHLKNGLSFVKMDAISPSSVLGDTRHSSDSAQVSHASISRRRSCPLPEWLANTFMSLSKKHPLRLLLPSDLAQAFPEESHAKNTQATETDGLFTVFDTPAPENDPHEEQSDSEFQQITSCGNGAMDVSDSDLPEPLPYATPGPGSRLGGFAIAPKSALSAVSLQTSSSPTLFNIENYLPLHKQSPHPIDRPFSKALTTFDHCDDFLLEEFDSDPDPSPLADNPYLAQVYAFPGPTYRATAIDSSLGDPLTLKSEATSGQLNLDFQWRPFDRKRLVAPALSKAPAFAANWKRSTTMTYSDNVAIVKADRPSWEASQDSVDQFETISPISPSPFSFSPLDVDDSVVPTPAKSAFDPESHDHSHTPPLQMLPSALVLAMYTPPLSLPPEWTPGSPCLAEIGLFSKDREMSRGAPYAISEDSFIHNGHNLDSGRSPSSLDSVEFWKK